MHHEFQDMVPALLPDLRPPEILGTAALAHRAYAGAGLADLLNLAGASGIGNALDSAIAHRLCFQAEPAAAMERLALARCSLFRVAPGPQGWSARPLRVLALVAPGDFMVNTPLEFIVRYLDVRLDLLFVRPGIPLPPHVPDHDVAFFAVSESDLPTLWRLQALFEAWPRPALNEPAAVARLSRDTVAAGLAAIGTVCSPPTRRMNRRAARSVAVDRAMLIRPVGSHAGHGLEIVHSVGGLEAYLRTNDADEFFVTDFVDSRGPDGLFRKYRVAFVDGAPFLCHMALSTHWMVHYLNAEMATSPARRAEEARAMAEFDGGFATRHARAFSALCGWMALDYFQIDCAEMPDGRLLVFEADVAAIVHLMDPPEMFAYKPAQMRRVFAAFDAMLRKACNERYQLSLANGVPAR